MTSQDTTELHKPGAELQQDTHTWLHPSRKPADHTGFPFSQTLAHPSEVMNDTVSYETGNYPPPGDCESSKFRSVGICSTECRNSATASGGYGSADTFTDPVQRGQGDLMNSKSNTGLIDQSVNGGPIGQEIDDANQGHDEHSRRQFIHEAERDFDRGNVALGLNPCEDNPNSRREAAEMSGSQYADSKSQLYESGAARGNDGDVGA